MSHSRAVGLFAGIGGLELGLQQAGFETELLVEKDVAAAHVLRTRFDGAKLHDDVTTLPSLPQGTHLLAAGFPCQDLSSVGPKSGLKGSKSSLVDHVFRLLDTADVPHVLLENVPFLMQLAAGAALKHVTSALESRGFDWCYRIVDSMAFGLPQRRRRWLLFASREVDPRRVLLADEVEYLPPARPSAPGGFYWTEGTRALGWTADGIPPLKVGSSVGVASPPAIWLGKQKFITPDIRDAERLQGFAEDWTAVAEEVTRPGFRWGLVGNAVSVPVSAWVAKRIVSPGSVPAWVQDDVCTQRRQGSAGWCVAGKRGTAMMSPWPVAHPRPGIAEFLRYPGKPLSVRAASGFLKRARAGSLRFPSELLGELGKYVEVLG